MGSAGTPFVPPAPPVPAQDPPVWRILREMRSSTLGIWSERAFDVMVARSAFLGYRILLVNDPDGIRRVLHENAANYRRTFGVRRVLRPIAGSGVFLAEGAQWRRQRRSLAPTFTPAAIHLLLAHFHAAAEHLLRGLEGGREANLAGAFQDTALEAVLRALFSMPEDHARERLRDMVGAYVEGPGRPGLLDGFATREDAFWLAGRRRRAFAARWSAAIDAIVAARRGGAKAPSRDLLDLLIGLRDAETGEPLSDVEIRDQCATMLFAGSETTARAMFWTVYLLAQDMAEQERVRAEIAAFPPDRASAPDDLSNWPRLRNALLEAMRLYPPVAHIFRDALGPDVVAGEAIDAGAQVWISAWVLHRHRRFWSAPTAFAPDRFTGKAAPWTQTPGYIPFGAGPRICLGLAFALAEAQIVLARVLARYVLSLADDRPVLPVGRVTIEPCYQPRFHLTPV